MDHRNQTARPGIEVLLVDARQDHTLYSLVVLVVRACERFAAIDGDFVSVVHQNRADLLGKLLEPTVAIGNAASTDNRDLQGRSSERTLPWLREEAALTGTSDVTTSA